MNRQKILKFNKEDGLWYIDLPDYPGKKEDLRMVAGADTFLDVLDKDNENTISVIVNTKEFNEYNIKLKRLFKIYGGATYYVKSETFKGPIWLCAVTKYVFNNVLPKRLYIQTTK